MFDYMAKYEDMGYYYVTISEGLIDKALENLNKKMNFIFVKKDTYHFTERARKIGDSFIPETEYERPFYLYRKDDDERAYVLATQWLEYFWGIAVKCRTSEKELFFNTLWTQILESADLDGISYGKIEEYPDHTYIEHSAVEADLRTVGLI